MDIGVAHSFFRDGFEGEMSWLLANIRVYSILVNLLG